MQVASALYPVEPMHAIFWHEWDGLRMGPAGVYMLITRVHASDACMRLLVVRNFPAEPMAAPAFS